MPDTRLVWEPEGSPSDEAVSWDLMTWGQYEFPFIPSVDRYKWLETRHMVNISDRWAQDKTNDLQFAFFNGVGWESWENIWGIWNGITPRDAEATRRVHAIEHEFAKFLVSPDWDPLTPMHNYGVYASKWPLGGRDGLDNCQSQQLYSRWKADGYSERARECVTSTFITALSSRRRSRMITTN